MSLTPEQKKIVAAWVGDGDGLSMIQKKLIEQFQLSMTYRDVRFLVDDLNLDIKDAAPKLDTSDVTKAQPAPEASPARRRRRSRASLRRPRKSSVWRATPTPERKATTEPRRASRTSRRKSPPPSAFPLTPSLSFPAHSPAAQSRSRMA